MNCLRALNRTELKPQIYNRTCDSLHLFLAMVSVLITIIAVVSSIHCLNDPKIIVLCTQLTKLWVFVSSWNIDNSCTHYQSNESNRLRRRQKQRLFISKKKNYHSYNIRTSVWRNFWTFNSEAIQQCKTKEQKCLHA